MKKIYLNPTFLSFVFILTFMWFSYLWWQDQQMQFARKVAKQLQYPQGTPTASTLPTPPSVPNVPTDNWDNEAAVHMSQ